MNDSITSELIGHEWSELEKELIRKNRQYVLGYSKEALTPEERDLLETSYRRALERHKKYVDEQNAKAWGVEI